MINRNFYLARHKGNLLNTKTKCRETTNIISVVQKLYKDIIINVTLLPFSPLYSEFVGLFLGDKSVSVILMLLTTLLLLTYVVAVGATWYLV